ncbi:MAG TPA: ribonuclease J [Dehalococcoidia bacterium]|nr:ribonuclease J [Dehalococcoidia bacterium]
MARQTLRVIPLGGLGEIGKNMMAFELADDIVVVDCGLQFPEQEMLGVDLVIPDISYLLERADKVRAILLTHGHEDHIGALPYVLRDLNVPVYCTRLTYGLVSVKLKEHRLLRESDLRVIEPGTMIELGAFTAEFFRVAHSIPDACGIVLHTPFGRVIHTGDFKLDHTPVMGQHTDLPRLSELGSEGVVLLCADSTYAEVPGYTPSEQVVGEALDNIMNQAPGRIIVATFASLISRIQQVIDAAVKHDRRVFVVGRSMVDNVNMALEQGYLEAPNGVLGRIEELGRLPPERVAIVTTGSQGEPTSALARMSNQEHRWVDIIPGDTVVLSASPIPGNEQYVYQVVDNLFKLGAHVLYNRVDNIHVRGHAAQEELKLILSLVRPKYLLPIHGEYRHLTLHARLGQAMGMRSEETFVLEDGDVLEIDMDSAQVAGRVPAAAVYVDGLGVGDVDHVVLRDRRHLANDGMVVVVIAVDKQSGKVIDLPDVLSRGFVDAEEAAWLMDKARELARQSLDGADHRVEWPAINAKVKDTIAKFLYDETRRRPMVLPVAVEV